MRAVTFNIHHGAPPGGMVDHRGLSTAVASLCADVIALQEVDRHVVRSLFRDQTRLLARSTGTVGEFAPARTFGPCGRYGNALLVRGRTLESEILRLPGSGEARVAQLARVIVCGSTVTVAATHLQDRAGGRPGDAILQLRALLRELGGRPEPWLLLGDLNLRPEVADPVLADFGLDAHPCPPAHPAAAPRIVIDRIASRGLGTPSVEVPDVGASDHRPVVAEFAPTRAENAAFSSRRRTGLPTGDAGGGSLR